MAKKTMSKQQSDLLDYLDMQIDYHRSVKSIMPQRIGLNRKAFQLFKDIQVKKKELTGSKLKHLEETRYRGVEIYLANG